MYIYIGFDDTDAVEADQGTGKVARWFEKELPSSCKLVGVVRQQLLIHEDIPYTSHNSSACLIIETKEDLNADILIERAVKHLKTHSLEGSDPGVCVACVTANNGIDSLVNFGRKCVSKKVTQREAMDAASHFHLSGHGGTNDGIIGAAAAVGLSASKWNGRFIEFGRLREYPNPVKVSALELSGIRILSIDRDAKVPALDEYVNTKGWLRPRLVGGEAVLFVTPGKGSVWESVGEKKKKIFSEPSCVESGNDF